MPDSTISVLKPPSSELPITSRLALGTVQFGLPYGIANRRGQVSIERAEAILKYARDHGISTLDTAIAYGNSETRLGEIGVKSWQIVSKLPSIPENCHDVRAWVRDAVEGSLDRLHIGSLYGLLLHRPDQLLYHSGEILFKTLTELKADNLISKIGISIYDPVELDTLCERYRFDIIQAPFNVLNRRLLRSGWLSRLHKTDTEVHIRSVFLQGLLLMRPEDRPEKFRRWQPIWDKWEGWIREADLTALKACLDFVLSFPEIDRMIVGVDTLGQLKEILSAADGNGLQVPDELECTDTQLINPSLWQTL